MGRQVISPSYMSEVLKYNPDSLLFARYAHTLIVSKKLNAAQKIAEEGVKKYPNYASGRFILALCYVEQGDKKAAVLQLIELLKTEPTFQQALALLAKLLYNGGENETSKGLIDFLLQNNPNTRLLGKLAAAGEGKKTNIFEIFSCEHNWKEYASENYGKGRKTRKIKVFEIKRETVEENTKNSSESSSGGSLEQEISEAIYQGAIPADEENPDTASEKAGESEPETKTPPKADEENPDTAPEKTPEKAPAEPIGDLELEIKIPPKNEKDIQPEIDDSVFIDKKQDKEKEETSDEIKTAKELEIKIPPKNENDVQAEIDDSVFIDKKQDKEEETSDEIKTAKENIPIDDGKDSAFLDGPANKKQEANIETEESEKPKEAAADENPALIDNAPNDTQKTNVEEKNSQDADINIDENPAVIDDISQKAETDKTDENPVELVENTEDFSPQAVQTNADLIEKNTVAGEEFSELKNIVEESMENLPPKPSFSPDEKNTPENPNDLEIPYDEIKNVVKNEKDKTSSEISITSPEKNEIILEDIIQNFDDDVSDKTSDNHIETGEKYNDILIETPEKSHEKDTVALDNKDIVQNFDDDDFDNAFDNHVETGKKDGGILTKTSEKSPEKDEEEVSNDIVQNFDDSVFDNAFDTPVENKEKKSEVLLEKPEKSPEKDKEVLDDSVFDNAFNDSIETDKKDKDVLLENKEETDEVLLEIPESFPQTDEIVLENSEQDFTDKLSDTFDNSFEDYLKNNRQTNKEERAANESGEIALENPNQKFDEDEQKAEPLSEKEAFDFLIAKNGGELLPDHILTPTFAQIYLEQGQPYLAKQIYERLMLQDGENEEFAEKIEEIDDIIERMKKGEHISFDTLNLSQEKSAKRSLKGKRIKKEIREALIEKYFTKDDGEKDDEQV